MELALSRRSADGSWDERSSACEQRLRSAWRVRSGRLRATGSKGSWRGEPARFPWATFVVNVSGSFLLGLVFTLLTERAALAPWVRASVSIGFLGAYTTFSTLSLESYRLLETRSYSLAAANVLGSAAAGLLALYGGVVLGRAL